MSAHDYFMPELAGKIEAVERQGAIDLSLFKPGTILLVKTKNTLYRIQIVDRGSVLIQNGKDWEKPIEARIHGSTWGTSILLQDQICHDMHMEIGTDKGTRLTSPVESVRVEFVNGSFFETNWSPTPPRLD